MDTANPDQLTLALRFGAALGLGVLLGLERERKIVTPEFAGVRTIGLIGLLGALATYFEQVLGARGLALAVFGAVALLVLVSYAVTAWRGELGSTTEITALIAFLLGSLCLRGQVPLAAGLAVATAAMLAFKDWLHGLARRIEPRDVEATLQFAILTLIILPLVPNETYGPPPLDVLNPYRIWLMVVLISGINFASYLVVKFVGPEHGLGLTGLLGGLVSSTAVTLGFAQRSRNLPGESSELAVGILLAWAVMFVRVVVLSLAISPPLARRLVVVMGALAATCIVVAWFFHRHKKVDDTAELKSGANPFELRQAVQFALLFGFVTVLARAAEVWIGDAGLYLAGAVAGLTDVDAITLSLANLAAADPTRTGVGALAITIAAASNTLVKAGIAAFAGHPALRRQILPAALVLFAVGTVLTVVVAR